MKEKLTQFAKGEFPFEKPALLFSVDFIEFSVESGNEYKGVLTVTADGRQRIKGIACSNDYYLKIKEKAFYGTEAKIEYCYDAKYLSPGETHSGSIRIISNGGEYEIPFMARISVSCFQTTAGEIGDLYQFSYFAKKDWQEALKLFQTKEFRNKLLKNDLEMQIIYDSLLKSASPSHGMEEFLVSVHKKACVGISIDRTFLEYSEIKDDFTDEILVKKDSWGFLEVKLSSDCDFIQLDSDAINSEDFIGGQAPIAFKICSKKLRKGRNEGVICFRTGHQILYAKLIVSAGEKKDNASFVKHKQSVILTQTYLNFRMKRIDAEQYLEELKQLLPGYYEVGNLDEYYLLKAHIAISEKQEEEMKEAFQKLQERREAWAQEGIYECAYRYLYAMYKADVKLIEESNEKIDDLYKKTDSDWKLFWFLLNIDVNLLRNPDLKQEAIEALLENGCCSPVLYFEMAETINKNPCCIKELHGYRYHVLSWMIREKYASDDVKQQYVYLASRMKKFHPVVYRDLVILYEDSKDQEVLRTIVSMLIRSQRADKKYEKWYKLGVENQLRITQLYEFYMYSLEESLDVIFPENVLQYFLLSIHVDENKKAFFYANLVHNKNSYKKYYASYLEQMKEFVRTELLKKVINWNMAVLYSEFLNHRELDMEEKKALPNVMFCYELACNYPDVTGAVLIHNELEGEVYVPFVNGKAQVQLFTDNWKLFLIDRYENRYVNTIEYSLKKMIQMDEQAESCLSQGQDNPMLLFYLYQQSETYQKYAKSVPMIRKRLLAMPLFRKELRWFCYMKQVKYYFDTMEQEASMENLDSLLEQLDFTCFSESDRIQLFEICVSRKIYVHLFEYLEMYGYEKIKPKKLFRYLEYYVQNQDQEVLPEAILKAAMFVMRLGKCSRSILAAIQSQYIGCLDDLEFIWEKAMEFQVPVTELEEQIVSQDLFTESFRKKIMNVFESYYGKPEKNRLVVRAFLSYYCYNCIVRDYILWPELIEFMKDSIRQTENKLVVLALIKEISTKEKLSEEEINFVEINLGRFVKEKLILPFFMDFRGKLVLPFELSNKHYVKYVTNPQSHVMIHYTITNGKGNKEVIQEEPMTNVFYSIFIKEFNLFHNDSLQYYISEEKDGISSITESITEQYQNVSEEEESEYSMLNALLAASEKRDSRKVLELLDKYLKTGYVIREKFKKLD